MNEALADSLPKVAEGLGWKIETSGDGIECTVTIRLVNLFQESSYLVATEYALPKSCQPGGIVSLVVQQARELLTAYEKQKVLQTLPGLYDSGWITVDIDEDLEEQEQAA